MGKTSILASNGAIHEAMLEVIRPHHPGGPVDAELHH